jgi:hypothetical protein
MADSDDRYDGAQRASSSSPPEGCEPDEAALAEERARYRKLQIMIAATAALLEQDRSLTLREGMALVSQARRAAELLFPGKGPTFDLIYRPRLLRIIEERFAPAGSREEDSDGPDGRHGTGADV